METNVVIYTEIQTKPRPRTRVCGKFATIYTPKEAHDYEALIAKEYVKNGGLDFTDKPVIVEIDFWFKNPSNWPKWKIWVAENQNSMNNYIPCIIHKDLDNLAKSILDALNGLAYDDDRQVVWLESRKHWTTGNEKIRIRIVALDFVTEKELKENYKKWKKSSK